MHGTGNAKDRWDESTYLKYVACVPALLIKRNIHISIITTHIWIATPPMPLTKKKTERGTGDGKSRQGEGELGQIGKDGGRLSAEQIGEATGTSVVKHSAVAMAVTARTSRAKLSYTPLPRMAWR